ncbi:MAG TPA: VOC family protein, partial [Usitatibacter sp.]
MESARPVTRDLDHLVVAARTLEEGAAWVEAALGVPTVAGGKHDLMGTHNRLLGLDGRRYLEVIAIDPSAPPPARARWFGLDEAAPRERLVA